MSVWNLERIMTSRRTARRHACIAIAAALSLSAASAHAALIVTVGGGWRPMLINATVVCGEDNGNPNRPPGAPGSCQSDRFEDADLGDVYAIVGSNTFSRSAQSGPASAAVSIFGSGSEFATEDSYVFQFTLTSTSFASVAAGASDAAFAAANIYTNGGFNFTLSDFALFSGPSSFGLQSGSVLAPGAYSVLLGNLGSSVDRQRAGQQALEMSMHTLTYRFDAVQVPEPGTLGLLAFGLLGAAGARRRARVAER
jgi:PEP-CTERM motif